MAAKSNPVTLGTSNTTIYECPATFAAYVQLFITNITGAPVQYQLKFLKQSTGVTSNIAPPITLAANAPLSPVVAFSMEAGDRIIGTAVTTNAIVAVPTISLGDTAAAIGLTPRGEWASGTTYAINDVVSVVATGNSWISLQNGNLNNVPGSAPAYWMLLSARGATGAAGAGDMIAANNLSEIPNDATACDNIGALKTLGGTMTGDLTIAKATPLLVLDCLGVAGVSDVRYNRNGGRRWLTRVSSDPETGGNAGSNYALMGYADDGASFIGIPMSASRVDGRITLFGDPTAALHAATKQYVDARARKNFFFNGAMDIDQRNNGATVAPAAGYNTLDRWGTWASSAVWNVSRYTPWPAPGLKNGMLVQRTAAAAASTIYLGNVIESVDAIKLQGKTVTLSFYAYAAGMTAPLGVELLSGTVADQGWLYLISTLWTGIAGFGSGSITLTGGVARYTVTGTVPTNCQELCVRFTYAAVGTAPATDLFVISGVQLEEGATATPFEARSYGEELALCQRYYEKTDPTAPAQAIQVDNYASAGGQTLCWIWEFKAYKRVNPTMSIFGTVTVNNSSLVGLSASKSQSNIQYQSTIAGRAYWFNSLNSGFIADAEL